MMRLSIPVLGMICFADTPAFAQQQPEYPGLVPAFLKACVDGELSVAARETAMAAEGWAETAVNVDVPSFNISGALDRNFEFSKPLSVKQWEKQIDGSRVRAVVATFPEKRRYPTICAFVASNVKSGWPYNEAFADGIKSTGLKGKSTDLPHYFEYSGKVGGTKPVRAEVSGRTRVVPDKNAMHLYIAF
jgi:hypothetical protein